MGTFKFSMTMLKKELSKAISFGITMFFVFMTTFVFFAIIDNDKLIDHTQMTSGYTLQQVSVPISTVVSFVIIMFCCYMLAYANNFFLSHKTKELAILAMSGSTFIDTTFYLLYQIIVIIIVTLPLGILAGTGVSTLTNYIMFHYMGVSGSVTSIPVLAYRDTLITVVAVLGMVLMLDAGYVYRHDISYLLMQEDANDISAVKGYRIPDFIYIAVVIIAIFMIVSTPFGPSAYTFPGLVGAFGLSRVICQCIPHLIEKLKPKIWINKKRTLVSMSSLSFSLTRSATLIMLYIMSSVTMIALLISQKDRPREFVTSLMGYFVIIILLSVSMMYKYMSEARHRRILFFNLFKLGYVRKDLRKMIRREVLFYYGILIIFPLIFVIPLLQIFIQYGGANWTLIQLLAGFEVLPPLLMAIVTMFNYQRIAMKKVEESIHE